MMVDIHLSWSPLQLYMAIVFLFVWVMIALVYLRNHKKFIALAALTFTLVVGGSAFDVGTRQADLNRGKFDVETPVSSIDKVESTHNTAASIKTKFDETTLKLKETK